MTSEVQSYRVFRTDLHPEHELLLACARRDLAPGADDRVRHLLGMGLDWQHLMTLADRHGLRPLLYRHLNALAPQQVPRAVFADLWAGYESNAKRNTTMAGTLLNIVQLLAANRIPALAYKGPVLAASLYGDLALREFADLDVLLRKDDILPACRLMEAQGYVQQVSLTSTAEAALLRSGWQYHVSMVDPAHDVLLELHWKTDSDFPIEQAADDAWWSGLAKVKFGEGAVCSFSPEELCLVLCLHGSKHRWSRLGWLVDVAELISRHPNLHWDWIADKAEALRCWRKLALGLHLAVELLDAPVPAEILRKIRGMSEITTIAATISATLFSTAPSHPGPIRALRLNLALFEFAGQKIVYFVNFVFAPSLIEFDKYPLPRWLYFMYPPLRVCRLAVKYAVGFARRRERV